MRWRHILHSTTEDYRLICLDGMATDQCTFTEIISVWIIPTIEAFLRRCSFHVKITLSINDARLRYTASSPTIPQSVIIDAHAPSHFAYSGHRNACNGFAHHSTMKLFVKSGRHRLLQRDHMLRTSACNAPLFMCAGNLASLHRSIDFTRREKASYRADVSVRRQLMMQSALPG